MNINTTAALNTMIGFFDKTFGEAYRKAVNLSLRNEEAMYVVQFPLGYRALSMQDILLTDSNRKPDVKCTVFWRGDQNES